ncbi:MAG: YCF48-related protein, partial [Bacteroidetes bacterium]|nr:YCF48-related protein [Bacteroidota bacterium]
KSFSQSWAPITSGTKARLNAINFPTQKVGYIAGQSGTILKTTDNGNTWSALTTQPAIRNYNTIYFLNKDTGWVGCDSGYIYATKDGGANWSQLTSGVSTGISCINMLPNGSGYASGAFSVVLRTNDFGKTWKTQKAVSVNFTSNFMFDSADVWLTGTALSSKPGTLAHSTDAGKTWTSQTTTNGITQSNFYDVQFITAKKGWLVGAKGMIRHTTDAGATTWSTQNSGTTNDLGNIRMLDAKTGWICGKGGSILSTKDGANWSAENSGVSSILWGIYFTDSLQGYAIGDSGVILKYTQFVYKKPLQLLSPNGGEVWKVKNINSIIWATKSVSNIKIDYSIDGGINWSSVAKNVNASSGSYAWSIPNTLSRKCLIKITDVSNSSNADTSDAVFTILNQPTGIDYSVLLTAAIQKSPAKITLNWVSDPNADEYSVYKKLPADTVWTFMNKLSGTTNTWADNSVSVGNLYEYQVAKKTPILSAYGYISSGIEIAETDYRGIMLLIVDSNYDGYLSKELSQYENDLIGEGWQVVRKIFNPATAKVTEIKKYIQGQYNTKPTEVKAVLLFGHLPTPYSGNYAPDGHSERVGAQPADVYYADMDGSWTDATTTTTNKGIIFTPNVPGDGKFDPSFIPGKVELMIGRVDMNNMGGFSLSEKDLLKQYLDKNHKFRFKINNPQRRALVFNQMDYQLATFSPVAHMSFTPMFAANNVKTVNTTTNGSTVVMDSLKGNNYLWTYVGGGGQDTAINYTVLSSYQLAQSKINTVFMQLLGSYFVEWNRGPNNLLRSPLANAGMPLATCWTGSLPYWYFHHMAMGETIGKSVMLSENNKGIYTLLATHLAQGVHMELMGDPSLKMHIVLPVSNLKISSATTTKNLSWGASADNNIVGYNIYRASSTYGKFSKINKVLNTSTAFTDSFPLSGKNIYMIRAVKLENTPSGTYYNMSQGIMDSLTFITGISTLQSQMSIVKYYPNPFSNVIKIEMPAGAVNFLITDVTGRKVYQQSITPNTKNYEWNAEGFSQGVYLLQVGYQDKSISTYKLFLK